MDLYVPDEARSKEALRFQYVFEQGFDSSCGFSAAASLLALYWGVQAEEDGLLRRFARADPASGSFSANMACLARIFSEFGLSAKGVRMDWGQLSTALDGFAPIVIHYDRPDRHFALALRAKDGWIITLDPALGCELQSREQFMGRWSGAALLVASSTLRRSEARLADAVRLQSDRLGLLERLGP